MPKQTASNTIGPFFHHILTPEGHGKTGITDNKLAGKKTKGERIRVEGRILDADGKPLRAAMLEIWQANAAGRYNSPVDDRDEAQLDRKFSGFGRVSSGSKGKFEFETIKPGAINALGLTPNATHVPSLALMYNSWFSGGPHLSLLGVRKASVQQIHPLPLRVRFRSSDP